MTPVPAVADQRLMRGALLITLFGLATSLARLAQDAAIAWRLGTGPEVDAYAWLVGLVQWPVTVALSTMTVLLAPSEAALPPDGGRARLRLRAELFASVLLLALVATPLAMAGLHAGAGSRWAALSPEAAAHAQDAAAWIALGLPLGLVGALFAAWLVAADHRGLTLAEALQPLVVTLALLLAGLACASARPCLLLWLCVASVAGLALQGAVQAALLHGQRGLPMPRLAWTSPAWRQLGDGALWLLAGQTLFALVPLVDTFVATRQGEGQLAALTFASRLLLGALGIVGLAVQRAGLPLLTRLAASARPEVFATAWRWALRAAPVAALAALAGAWIAEPTIALVFERGRFGAADRERVAMLLQIGLLQLPAYAMSLVALMALAACRATRAMAGLAVAGLALKLVSAPLLAAWLGLAGLPLSGLVVYVGSAALGFFLLRRQAART